MALYKVGKALNEPTLVERATKDAAVLLNVTAAQLNEVAKRLGGEDLVDPKIGPRPDAG